MSNNAPPPMKMSAQDMDTAKNAAMFLNKTVTKYEKNKIKPTLAEIYNFRFQSRLQFLTQSDNVDRCQRRDATRFQFRY